MHRETLNERVPLLRALDDVQVGRALVDRPPVIFEFSTCPWSGVSRATEATDDGVMSYLACT